MRLKNETKVITPEGEGVIVGIDLPLSSVWRYKVKLKNNPYNFDPVYFPKDIKELKDNT